MKWEKDMEKIIWAVWATWAVWAVGIFVISLWGATW